MNENIDPPAEKRDKTEKLQNVGILCAIIVSVSSFSLAVWQAQETRRLNRLSVRPIVIVEWHGNVKSSAMSLTNVGPGLAEITSVKLRYGERELTPVFEELQDLLFNKYRLPHGDLSYQVWDHPFMLESGETTDLLRLKSIEKLTLEEARQWMDFTYHIDVQIEYESIYGDKHTWHGKRASPPPSFPRNIDK